MAQDRTAGYDMLVQVSEGELNNQIATAFLAGAMFPSSMNVPVNQGGLVGTASLNFLTPTADLDRPRPRLGLTVPFSNSQLQITAPAALTLAPLAGTIVIVDTIEVITEGTNQIATMDFNAGAPTVTVAFDAASAGVLAPALAVAGMTQPQAENMMAGMVLQQLQTGIRRLDLTAPMPVVDDADPVTIFDIDVATVNDTSAADRDCITFGVKMSSDSGGNINNVTTCFIPPGGQSLVMMSNFWLLARVMRPRVAASLGRPVDNFDTPLRLNRNVPAPGGSGTLTSLEARVVGNRIRVDGRATASGTGWSAVSNFNFFIDIGLSGGSITVTATTPSVDTDVDLAWWVWLAGLGLGGLFGGIIGVIVAAIVLAIVEAVAESIASGAISSGVSGSLGTIPSIPLGPLGGGITLDNVILDDLELRCSIIRSLSVPVQSQGSRTSSTGFALDVDTGTISGAATSRSDLVWNPAGGLVTNGAARLAITGSPYGSMSPVQVSQMALTGTAIPVAHVPLSYPASFWFMPSRYVVFGMRTSDGRYAKVRAQRSIPDGGALRLEWLTWATPVARLDIASRWSVIERGDVEEYITSDCRFCRSSPVRWQGVFEAWPALLAFPIDYQWCLCGTVLQEGEGSVTSTTGTLSYKLEGRRLTIESEMAQDISCELCVSAIGARDRELFTCIQLQKPGIDRQCRRCEPRRNFHIEYLPALEDLTGWRPLIAHAAPGRQVS